MLRNRFCLAANSLTICARAFRLRAVAQTRSVFDSVNLLLHLRAGGSTLASIGSVADAGGASPEVEF